MEMGREHSRYLCGGRYSECIPCAQSRRLERERVRLGVKDKVVLLLFTPPSAPHSFTLALALLRDAPATASNSQPDSRIAELPNNCTRDRAFFQPALSVLGLSFETSFKTHRVLFVHFSEPDHEDAAA